MCLIKVLMFYHHPHTSAMSLNNRNGIATHTQHVHVGAHYAQSLPERGGHKASVTPGL